VLGLEPAIAAVDAALQVARCEVRYATTIAAGLRSAAAFRPELIIIGDPFPEQGGADLYVRLRARSAAAIMVVTSLCDEEAYAQALHAGADDYVVTPFRTRIFRARLTALLRRVPAADDEVLNAGDISIDLQTRAVTVAGRQMRLWPHEFDMLAYLVRRPSTVHTYRSLLTAIWGPSVQMQSHYVRMCVMHLRRRIELDPQRPQYLLNERGIGYRLEPHGLAAAAQPDTRRMPGRAVGPAPAAYRT